MRGPDSRTLPGDLQLDIDMLRTMYARAVSISGIDPRLNANRMARELHVSRARVAARLRAWTDYGFIQRYDVWPNPYLFGLTGASFDVRVDDRLAKDRVLARVALVPGAVGGIDFLGEWVTTTFVLPHDADPGRTAELLRGLAGVAEVGEVAPWAAPESPRPLTPLELRIVRVLRQFPRDSLAAIARHVGVSARTITTRYGRLIDERAVWFVPVFDFRALAEPVLTLNVEFRSADDREAFRTALGRAHPRSLEFRRLAFGPALPDSVGSFFVVGRSAASRDDLESWVRDQPGVRGHETLVMKRVLSFPETFDRLLPGAPATRRGSPSRAR